MASGEQSLFRKETMDRISSPEDLTDYLKVTNPGIWAICGYARGLPDFRR